MQQNRLKFSCIISLSILKMLFISTEKVSGFVGSHFFKEQKARLVWTVIKYCYKVAKFASVFTLVYIVLKHMK